VRGTRVQDSTAEETETLYLTNEIRPVSLVYVVPLTLVVFGGAAGLGLWLRSFLLRKLRKKNSD